MTPLTCTYIAKICVSRNCGSGNLQYQQLCVPLEKLRAYCPNMYIVVPAHNMAMFSIIRRFTLPCICCTTTFLGIQLLSPSTKESCPKNRGSVPHHVDMTLPFLVDSLYYVVCTREASGSAEIKFNCTLG